MKLSKDKTKILMLTHYYFREEGGEDTDERLLNFFKDRVKKIVLITNPFPESDSQISYCFIYESGQKVKELKFKIYKRLALLQYAHQIILIYFLLFKVGLNFDLCIALENFSLFIILPLRFLRSLKRLVYYSIDFVPNRFSSPMLNWFYHFIYKLACKYSDRNWVMTKEQIEASKLINITTINSAPFSIVPIGYNITNIQTLPSDKINFYNLVFAGGLRESNGAQLVIRTLPLLIKKFPKIHLTIVGTGKYENELKRLTKDLKITKYVDFKGYIADFKDLTSILSKMSIGLAPYAPIPGSFSYYSDPSKIKLYMCCGLPVIVTRVTTMSNIISKTHSGVVIDYSEESLYNAVVYLLSSKKIYGYYKSAASKLSMRFDIDYILNMAIREI